MLVLVEGNIGAGKSTLVSRVGAALRARGLTVIEVQEPLAEWGDGLERFYEDQSRWAFAFQIRAFGTRADAVRRALATAPPGAVVLCERSVYSDRAVFFKMLADTAVVTPYEAETYARFFPHAVADSYARAAHTLVLYMRSSPERCHDRMRARARAEEAGVSLEYLTRVHEAHERALVEERADAWPGADGVHVCDVEAYGNLATSTEVADAYAYTLAGAIDAVTEMPPGERTPVLPDDGVRVSGVYRNIDMHQAVADEKTKAVYRRVVTEAATTLTRELQQLHGTLTPPSSSPPPPSLQP